MPKLKQALLWSFGLTKTFAQPVSTSRFLSKLSPHSGKNIKKVLLTAGCLPVVPPSEGGDYAGCSNVGPRILLFNVFARRRGDFAEMMGVRSEARGACSPELTSSQTSRHAVPTASTGVFSVFFKILLQGLIIYSY